MRQHPAGRPGFRGPRRAIASVATLLVATTAAPRVASQSIDISPAHLRTGQALALSVRVRAEDAGPVPLPPRCIEAEWIADGRLWTSGDTRVRTRAGVDPAWTLVDLRHPHRLLGDQADVRLTLRCGPVYERHFRVFAAPGPTGERIARPAHQTTRQANLAIARKRRETAHPSPADAEAPSIPAREGILAAAAAPSETPPPSSSASGTRLAATPSPPPPDVGTATSTVPADRSPTPALKDGPTPVSLPNTSPGDVARLRESLERLQVDHQKTLSQLGVVRARLVHAERSPSATTWALLGGLLLMALAQLGRTGADRPLRPLHAHSVQTGLARWSTWARRATWTTTGQRQGGASNDLATTAVGTTGSALASSTSSQPTPADAKTGAIATVNAPPSPTVLAPAESATWRQGDFGKPTFDPTGVEDLLAEVERLSVDGFPAAAAMTIENNLMQQPGKHPALLLALLDLYEDMGQPWNRERVAAQLEALYNVALGDGAGHRQPDTPATQTGLEHCTASLDRICRAWRGPEATKAIDSLLRRPAALEVLPLAAFRDAVWLHRMASLQQALHDDDTLELSLAPLHGP